MKRNVVYKLTALFVAAVVTLSCGISGNVNEINAKETVTVNLLPENEGDYRASWGMWSKEEGADKWVFNSREAAQTNPSGLNWSSSYKNVNLYIDANEKIYLHYDFTLTGAGGAQITFYLPGKQGEEFRLSNAICGMDSDMTVGSSLKADGEYKGTVELTEFLKNNPQYGDLFIQPGNVFVLGIVRLITVGNGLTTWRKLEISYEEEKEEEKPLPSETKPPMPSATPTTEPAETSAPKDTEPPANNPTQTSDVNVPGESLSTNIIPQVNNNSQQQPPVGQSDGISLKVIIFIIVGAIILVELIAAIIILIKRQKGGI